MSNWRFISLIDMILTFLTHLRNYSLNLVAFMNKGEIGYRLVFLVFVASFSMSSLFTSTKS